MSTSQRELVDDAEPAVEIEAKRWSIRFSDWCRGVPCPITNQWDATNIYGWCICIDGIRVMREVAEHAPALLRQMLADLREMDAPGVGFFVVHASADPHCTQCVIDGVLAPLQRVGEWGIAPSGGLVHLIGPRAAYRLATPLAEVMHRHGQFPPRPEDVSTPKPPPVPKHVPTHEEIMRDALIRYTCSRENVGACDQSMLQRSENQIALLKILLGIA